MKPEKAVCVTKQSVDDLVRILDQTISLLNDQYNKKDEETGGSTFEYDEAEEIKELIKSAKSEREIYTKVKNMMDDKGHKTLCLMTS